MPVLNGLGLIRTLRSQQNAVPILMISAYPHMAVPALAAGATQFLLKPFSAPELQQVLLSLLPALP
jgi:CheY-like chemotaxis protein